MSARPATPQPERPDVFVSYSRKDEEFVDALVQALEARGKDVWIDRDDIRRGAEWWKKVESGIESARAVVAVLTPSFVESTVCRDEIEHAVALNKRLVPVLREQLDPSALHERLAALDWVFARPDDDFDGAVAELVDAAETDLEWLDQHARLNVRAGEWDRAARNKSFLLSGTDLQSAERWLARQGGHGERATPLQTEYILASRSAATRRQRVVLASVLGALALAVALAAVAFWQRGVALENERLAVENARQARSRELAATSAAQLGGDPELALLLAVEAARAAPTTQAEEALRAALGRTHAAGAGALRHPGLAAVAVSDDGRIAVTGSVDATARVWDLATGTTLAVLRGHRPAIFGDARQGITDVVLSGDGRFVVTAGADGTARVWESRTGRNLRTFDDHRGAVLAAALTPDGAVVATGGEDGVVRTWERATGRPLEAAAHGDSWVTTIVFSDDGRLVATSGADTLGVVIRDARTLRPRTRLPTGQVFTIAFGGDGRLLASDDDRGVVRVSDTVTGARVASAGGHGEFPSLAFDRRGERVASGGSTRVVKVWDAATGRVLAEFRGHGGRISALAFSPDGRFVASASADGTARVWDVERRRDVRVLRGHRQPVFFVTFVPDGRLVTAGADGTTRIWSALPQERTAELRGHAAVVNDVALSGDGSRVATGSSDGTARLWDAASGRPTATLAGHDGSVTTVRFSPDDRLVLTLDFDRARLWDASNGRLLRALRGAPGHRAEFTADSRHVIASTGRIWDVATGRLVASVRGVDDDPFAFAVRRDGSAFFATPAGTHAGVFSVPSGRRLVALPVSVASAAQRAAFAPDGRMLALHTDRVALYDTVTGKRTWALPAGEGLASADAFGGDGSLLLTTTPFGVRVWDTRRRRPVADLPHPRGIGDAEFSRDGRLVLTAGWDGAGRVWEARTARLIAALRGRASEKWSEGFAPAAAFAPRGRRLVAATGGDTAFVHVCELCAPLRALLALANRRLTRELTPDERATYLGS